jgi:hypothetical protein
MPAMTTETTTLTEPFDRELYDAAMQKFGNPPQGFELGVKTAARIVAERAATAPSDEELGNIAYRSMLHGEFIPWDQFRNGGWHDLTKTTAADYIRIGRDVRAALQPAPVIPEEWHLHSLDYWSSEREYTAILLSAVSKHAVGRASTWQDALADAIAAIDSERRS